MSNLSNKPAESTALHAATQSIPRKLQRWTLRLCTVLALLLAILLALVWYGLQAESGARVLWQTVSWAMDGKLTGRFDGGSLAQGLRLSDLHYHDKNTDVKIDHIDSAWKFLHAPWHWNIDFIRIGKITIAPGETPPSPAPVLPQHLRLPLAITLRQLSVNQFTFHKGASEVTLDDMMLSAESDGTQHALVLHRLSTPYGLASATFHLHGAAPFEASANAKIAATYLDEHANLDIAVSGLLSAMQVDINASGDKINGTARVDVTPFQQILLKRLTVDMHHINPKVFVASAPLADIALHAALTPTAASGEAFTMGGYLSLANSDAGSLGENRLPIKSASADVLADAKTQELNNLAFVLSNNGKLTGQGHFTRAGTGDFQLQVEQLDLHSLHTKLRKSNLHGQIAVKLDKEQQDLSIALSDSAIAMQADLTLRTEDMRVQRAEVRAGRSQLSFSGVMARTPSPQYSVHGKLSNFDPAAWLSHANYPRDSSGHSITANINADFDLQGALTSEPQVKLKFAVKNSMYDNAPLIGEGNIDLLGRRLLPSDAHLSIAGNHLALKGSFGSAHDAVHFTIDAPQLDNLGYGLSGAAMFDGELTGTLLHPKLHAIYHAEQLQIGDQHVHSLSGQADVDSPSDGKAVALDNLHLSAVLNAQGYQTQDLTIDQLNINMKGRYARHDFHADANGMIHGKPIGLTLDASGALKVRDGYAWSGRINMMKNSGQPNFSLEAPMTITASSRGVTVGATRIDIAQSVIDLKSFDYANGKIQSEGNIDALHVGALIDIWNTFNEKKAPVESDAIMGVQWNVSLTDVAHGFVQIEQHQGDVSVDNGQEFMPLGLSGLRVRADLQANRIQLAASANANGIGSLSVQGSTSLETQAGHLSLSPASPLSAQVAMRIPQLKSVSRLIGPQVLLDGAFDVELTAGGTLSQPEWSGTANGDKLALTLFDQGIHLRDGHVLIDLQQNQINLRQFEFHGGDGTLKASGQIQLDQSNPNLAASVVADRLQLFASANQQLTLSGQAQFANRDQQLHLDGKFKIDHALFDLPQSAAPKLGDDVVIAHRNEEIDAVAAAPKRRKTETVKAPNSFAPVMDIQVDLGDDFRFKGQGADLLLGGTMKVQNDTTRPLRATGTISVVEGTYEAFGRKLGIEQGQINFLGPLDNPNINILAMRRGFDVEAGVQISGTAISPRVKLVSEPNVADEEKLSWLMFGHGSDSSNASQLRAADAMLALANGTGGKRLAQTLGVDQFSVGSSESGLNDQQVLSVGKAVSERFYLGYEQSLSGAASIVKFTWQLSRRWSVVVRGGAINSLDLLFNLRYD